MPQIERRRKASDRVAFRPSYSILAQLYDFLIGDSALSALAGVFHASVERFGLRFRTLADIGCGAGRFLEIAARWPVRLVGVDSSSEMLALARRRLGRRALLLRQDIRQLRLPFCVDLVVCQNQTINYLVGRSDLRSAFTAVARCLSPGGAFLFDFIPRRRYAAQGAPQRMRETVRLPDQTARFDALVEPAHGRSMVNVRFASRNGHVVTERHVQRWPPSAEVHRALRASGFCVLDMRPVAADGEWLHVVARRI